MIYNVACLEAGFVFLAPHSPCPTFFHIRVLGFCGNGDWRIKYNLLAKPTIIVSVAQIVKTAYR
jgi:hypothetical protein